MLSVCAQDPLTPISSKTKTSKKQHSFTLNKSNIGTSFDQLDSLEKKQFRNLNHPYNQTSHQNKFFLHFYRLIFKFCKINNLRNLQF